MCVFFPSCGFEGKLNTLDAIDLPRYSSRFPNKSDTIHRSCHYPSQAIVTFRFPETHTPTLRVCGLSRLQLRALSLSEATLPFIKESTRRQPQRLVHPLTRSPISPPSPPYASLHERPSFLRVSIGSCALRCPTSSAVDDGRLN